MAGHDKAVSYVKFLDSETLVSASTDNTLKLWDLKKSNSTGLSPNACSLTLTGHTNEKVIYLFVILIFRSRQIKMLLYGRIWVIFFPFFLL